MNPILQRKLCSGSLDTHSKLASRTYIPENSIGLDQTADRAPNNYGRNVHQTYSYVVAHTCFKQKPWRFEALCTLPSFRTRNNETMQKILEKDSQRARQHQLQLI